MPGARYAVLIASSTFPDEPRLTPLTAPENDVDGLKAVLLSPDRGSFSDVKVLKNRPHYEIASQIHRAFKLAKKDDLVMVYYSGHGKPNQSGDLYLTAVDTDLDELESSAIGISRIREFLNTSLSKQVIIILDCCYSGAAGRAFAKSTIEDQLKAQASQARGTYMMTASTGIQTALEKEGDRYSVFTKHLIAGIETGDADTNHNGEITVDELYDYLHPRVRAESHQEPTRWNVDTRGHLIIANSGRQPKQEEIGPDDYQKSAEQGDVDAQFNLGMMYAKGEGVPRNMTKAVHWLRKAGEHGHISSQIMLGWMYQKGEIIPKDSTAAVEWYRKAAEHEEPNAQFNLGMMYAKGEGIPKNPVAAVEWLRKAAEQGSVDAQLYLGYMYHIGQEIRQDYGKALEWYQKAADQGDANAQNNLGTMYQHGLGIQQDHTKAVEWYRKAAEQGHADAQFHHGWMYHIGKGIQQDHTKAVEWYQKAADQGDADAQNNLGTMYQHGLGIQQDHTKAMEWFQKAADQGHAVAQNNLGAMYQHGLGIQQDHTKAVEWYQKAAEQGHTGAKRELDRLTTKKWYSNFF